MASAEKTFTFETDAMGQAVVHHVNGRFYDAYYHGNSWKVWDEIEEQFDMSNTLYLAALDISIEAIDGGAYCGRGGGDSDAGRALIPASGNCFNVGVTAHELGHAFGLMHDNRANGDWISTSYTSDPMITSFCAAEWLDVHRYFNTKQSSQNTSGATVQMLPPSLAFPPNGIHLRFEVSDPDGLHQVQLHTPEIELFVTGGFLACKRLTGTSSIVEFVTTDLIPKTKSVQLQVIDAHGNFSWNEQFPIDVTSLLPPSKVVSIPDANLAAAVQHEIGWPITTHTMLNLDTLDIPNRQITDLTGLEHAHHLRRLYLGGEWVHGRYVNSNEVSNFSSIVGLTQLKELRLDNNSISNISALGGLTQLTSLDLNGNSISDISALAGLTQLTSLDLNGNSISDISALAGLTQLTSLDLNGNSISDISALGGLTQLTSLSLGDNSILDISALRGLTQLKILYLHHNLVSDISALAGLTQLTHLYLWNNSILDISALRGLTQLTWLFLGNNSILDISALRGLTQLTQLSLGDNSILDISALAGLTQLTYLFLGNNSISDVSPLLGLNLTGREWDSTGLYLGGNPLSYASINTHIPAMQAKGIEVKFDPRTPTTLVKISGIAQQGIVNTTLALPFVVEVRDQYNRAFSGVPVTFTITADSGKLSATDVTTDSTGRAQTRLTLGRTSGTTTVSVAAAAISESVHFTVTAGTLSSPVTVPDAALRGQIASALGRPDSGSLTMGDMLRLTALSANTANIGELTGLQYAANLTTLSLDNNNLSDVALLAGLTQLKTLSLNNNNLSDVSPLAGLTQLTTLSLDNNNLSDVSTLVKLPQLKTLHLRGNPLNYPSLHTYIPTLQAGGVEVAFDPRTPTTVLKISGDHGVSGTSLPFVVEVQDEKGLGFSGVPLTFSVTTGGGHLSPSTATTDGIGRARITLTLGGTPGKHTVQVSAAAVRRPVSFTIIAIDGSTLVAIPDAALRSKIATTLDKPDGAQLTAEEMLRLTNLNVRNANIQDLTGLESAYNLRELWLGGEWVSGNYVNSNAVSNFSPLLGLTQLATLDLSGNSISDISALAGLTQLTSLYLGHNPISDISALRDLTQLTWLYLDNNSVSDISALRGLTQLTGLYLWNNSISDISVLGDLTQLTSLGLGGNSISDISALGGLTNLTGLYLYSNSILDISALAGLIQLTSLNLSGNSISDISALGGLTQLNTLYLGHNSISDVSPLLGLNLTGTEWDSTGLYLWGNPLSYASINTHIPAMQAKGIEVQFDNRTHPALLKISGDNQKGAAFVSLAQPFVVEAQDENGSALTGISITFAITAGGGSLSVTDATTDANGRAQSTLTLGPNLGMNTVEVSAAGIASQITFYAISDTGPPPMTADVNNDGVGNVLDLILIASELGNAGTNLAADVNRDGIVSILDLVLAAGLFEGAAAAPSAQPQAPEALTAVEVQGWLVNARSLETRDLIMKRGIIVLEQLLVSLTPTETELLANYPNPFNPETWIPYQLAEDGFVTLTIYDTAGQIVRTLEVGHRIAAVYKGRAKAIHWDGRNGLGEQVASGVYFYHLSAGDYSAARKMVILK